MSTYRFTPTGEGRPSVRRAADKTNEIRLSTYVPRHAAPEGVLVKLRPAAPQPQEGAA